MENTKNKYFNMKVETKQEYKKAQKLINSGWVAIGVIGIGWNVQFCKISI